MLYYSKYWLNEYLIDMTEDLEEKRLMGTHNIYELYNRRIIQKVAIKHPRMTISVNYLIDGEDLFNKK